MQAGDISVSKTLLRKVRTFTILNKQCHLFRSKPNSMSDAKKEYFVKWLN